MNSSNSVDINGNKIRLIREQKGLTQLYLATVVGVTTDTISRWENRRYPSIKLENAKKLAEALEVSLEELLEMEADREPDAEIGGEEAAADKAVSSLAGRIGVPWPRGRWWILAGAGVLIVAALAWAVIVTNRSGMEAVRIMPAHTAPNLSFPVLIRITGALDAGNTLLIRDELLGEGQAIGAEGEGSPKEFGKNPRWIGKLAGGEAAFLYLVKPDKKLRPDDEIEFAGDLITREGQSFGEKIGGERRITIAPYHWADRDKDYVISDSEILRAHETYSLPGSNLIDFNEIEELWLAGKYDWNKKTQTFVPVAPTEGKQ